MTSKGWPSWACRLDVEFADRPAVDGRLLRVRLALHIVCNLGGGCGGARPSRSLLALPRPLRLGRMPAYGIVVSRPDFPQLSPGVVLSAVPAFAEMPCRTLRSAPPVTSASDVFIRLVMATRPPSPFAP
jgi:hypothetical protein